MPIFNEDNTIEQMVITSLKSNGWKYIPAEELPRDYSDVMVEPMVKDALIRLNPEIAEDPSRADEVIYKLRTMMMHFSADNLVAQNETFKKKVFEENTYPFGEDGRMVSVNFFGTMTKEQLALNEYVVTNQWVYPQKENGKRLDIVLLINGFPVAIGELKTPVRNAITWLDGANDISSYEQTIPEMFVSNIFNFATEGKCYRYGSVGMPINMWGPWHTSDHKTEGNLADVKVSIDDMITPERIMDIFQFFTLFATDKKHVKYNLIIVPPHFERYIRFSRLARAIYADYSNQIEPFGLDEAWVDVTGNTKLFGDGDALANEIRERVKFELGITVSIGLSYNKIFAKLGSDYKKPDAVTVFTRENFQEKVWPLPAEDLLYVGRATSKKLHGYGIHTIGQIAETDPRTLHGWFGKCGLVLSAFANGDDTSPVSLAGDEAVIKSVGNSTTTPRDLENDEDAKIIFYMLCESVAERMREDGFFAKTVQISLRDKDLNSFERQLKLQTPTCLASELHVAAMQLLRANYSWQKPLRTVGVRATDLIPASTPQQLTMFEDAQKRERMETIERTVDDIRRRFGHYAIGRAITTNDKTLTNINPKEDHTIHPVGFFKAV